MVLSPLKLTNWIHKLNNEASQSTGGQAQGSSRSTVEGAARSQEGFRRGVIRASRDEPGRAIHARRSRTARPTAWTHPPVAGAAGDRCPPARDSGRSVRLLAESALAGAGVGSQQRIRPSAPRVRNRRVARRQSGLTGFTRRTGGSSAGWDRGNAFPVGRAAAPAGEVRGGREAAPRHGQERVRRLGCPRQRGSRGPVLWLGQGFSVR